MRERPDRPGAQPGTLRGAVERASAQPLVYLHQLPRAALLAMVAGLLVAGFALPGPVGSAALVLVAAFLGWLGYLSWPTLAPGGRLMRVAAVACVLVCAVVQASR